jgi:hypothetical protein
MKLSAILRPPSQTYGIVVDSDILVDDRFDPAQNKWSLISVQHLPWLNATKDNGKIKSRWYRLPAPE